MSEPLSNSAKRVQDFIHTKGFSFEVRELPGSTRTAQEAADSIGCHVSQIAKSLVFIDKKKDKPILIVASGSNRVQLKKIEKVLGYKLKQADAQYIKDILGFAIGGIPPAGHKVALETILDLDLQRYDTIWAAAGTPFAVFQLKPDDLMPLTDGTWMEIC